MIASWEILKLNVIKLLKGLHVFFVKQSLSVFLPSAAIFNVDFSWYLIYVKRGDLKIITHKRLQSINSLVIYVFNLLVTVMKYLILR